MKILIVWVEYEQHSKPYLLRIYEITLSPSTPHFQKKSHVIIGRFDLRCKVFNTIKVHLLLKPIMLLIAIATSFQFKK